MGTGRSRNAARPACWRICSNKESNSDSIVPTEDPWSKALSQAVVSRIVRGDISKDFDVSAQVLGTGYSGSVCLGRHRQSGQPVAVKRFSKRRLKGHKVELLKNEVEVYLRLDHPNVCKLLFAYESAKDVALVMELCACELYTRVCERKAYRESDAAEVVLQMLQAVNYLHCRNIVHRDLKLENWMYGEGRHGPSKEDRLKLIDFGFSRILSYADETLDLPCGTLHYTSPQVLRRNYTSKCDMWSLGVIAYMLVTGKPPFRGDNNKLTAAAILNSDFPKDGRWVNLSRHAKDFITSLLEKDANKRPIASVALLHPWMEIVHAKSMASSESIDIIDPEVLRSLRKYASSSHLRRASLLVMAYSLTSQELEDVERSFLALDKSRSGIVTLSSVAEVLREHLGAEEAASQEITRILESLDVNDADEGIHYTSFVAAMLATRVRLNEDKVRAAFEAFDKAGTGFITAETLVSMFSSLSDDGRTFTQEEAQQWINEVDYKRNGVIDYNGFLEALTGKIEPVFPALTALDGGDMPTVRVFEDYGCAPRARGLSESYVEEAHVRALQALRSQLVAVIVDGDELKQRAHTFPIYRRSNTEEQVHVRNVACRVDERYFSHCSSHSGSDVRQSLAAPVP